MKKITEDRIKGCLVGAYIGAEIGFLRWVKSDALKIDNPEEIPCKKLDPVFQYEEQEKGLILEK